MVELQGHTEPGDGGGGFFRVNEQDATSPDDDGVVIIDRTGTRWKRLGAGVLTPEMFGATGESADRDTAAIRGALAALPPGGTLRLRTGRTYYCRASEKRLEQHWNNIPRLRTANNSSFIPGETITGVKSSTKATVVGIDSDGVYLGLRDLQGSGFKSREVISSAHGGNSTVIGGVEGGPGGPPFYDTHAAFELTKPLKIEGRGTLKLIGTGDLQELPSVFANSKDTPIDGLSFHEFTIDLDITRNANSGQPRGILLISCRNVEISDSVEVRSSSSKGGYAVELFDCHIVKARPNLTNISGGIFAAYCTELDFAPNVDGFNEAIDIDKVCDNVRLGGTYRHGAKISGQVFDVNASSNIVIDSVMVDDAGQVLRFNGKRGLANNWQDHIAGINRIWRGAQGCTVSDNCEFYNCNYEQPRSSALAVGDQWVGNAHPGARPVSNIYIGGKWTRCGRMFVYEADGIHFNCQLRDISSTADAVAGAVQARSESDWATYPDAEDWSDLRIRFGPNFEVDQCDRAAIEVDSASELIIDGIKVRRPAMGGTRNDNAISIRNIDKRSTKGTIAGCDIDCAAASNGIAFLGDGTGTPRINIKPNRITGWIKFPYRLNGTVAHGLVGRKWRQQIGDLANDKKRNTETPALAAPPNGGILVIAANWIAEAAPTRDGEGYHTSARSLDVTAKASGNNLVLKNDSVALSAHLAQPLRPARSDYIQIGAGQSVVFRREVSGAGSSDRGTLVLEYLEWSE